MDWRYWLAQIAQLILAMLAGGNAHALGADASPVMWAGYVGAPLAALGGAGWYATARVGAVAKRDRSLEIASELVRELTAAGRLRNVTSTGEKFAVEFKPEGK